MATKAEPRSAESAWLLRALLVLQSPRAVFAAIRDDSEEAAHARQEPITALVWLAGMAAVLAAPAMNTLMDDPARRDAVVVAILIFFAGGIYGIAVYWVLGAVLYYACRWFGSQGTYRRARHVLGFALAPLALALVVFWPIRIAIEGRDLFRYGGSDGGHVFADTFYVFVAWSIVLLAIGVRTVHGWSRGRTLAAVATTTVVSALVVFVSALL
ncbi:MAG: YIP1 family protein [Actinobacteria bacterium]|nr:MAG: YIP1 family protein [Actinomycetota bacterium]